MNLFSFDTATRETAQHTAFTEFDIKFPSIGRGGIVFEQAGRIWHFDLATHQSRAVPVSIREDGAEARSVLTNVSKFIQTIEPAPDGQRAVVVARGDVFTVPAKNGPTRNITRSQGTHERNATWSPDGKWIAYISDATGENEIVIVPQAGGAPIQITRDADTYYLRHEWSPDSKKSNEPKKPAAKKPVVVTIDAEGLADRIIGLPIAPSNYSSLRMLGDLVFYRRVPGGPTGGGDGGEGFGATRNERSVIATYSLKDLKETELGNFDSFSITDDGKRMLVRSGRDVGFVDLPSAKIELKDKLDFSALDMRIDRGAEWTQIFNEIWRQMRDFFYAPNMHGIDWPAQRDKYAALVPHVRHRNDLTYLIGELIGELRAGHTYVGGGDRPEIPRVKVGLLGAELSRDPASRAYRIDRILKGDNWQSKTHSPLTEIGVNVAEGEYILAVDGQPVTAMSNIYASLVGTVGRQVSLRVAKSTDGEGARDVTVVPIADEAPLYYEAWVAKNIAHVAERTDGRAGYLHIPDMGPQGLNEFVRRFYPQLNKEALVIDVRGNGGGNVSG